MKKDIFGKLKNKLSMLFSGSVSVGDIFLEIWSHLINFTKFQRHLRKKYFSLEKVQLTLLKQEHEKAYEEFINSLSRKFRITNNYSPRRSFAQQDYSNKNMLFGAFYNGRMIGVTNLACRGERLGYTIWLISGLNIKKAYQGLGIGEKLIRTALSSIREGNNSVYLNVLRTNFRAINLYKKLGFEKREYFQPATLLETVPQDTADSIHMIKIL